MVNETKIIKKNHRHKWHYARGLEQYICLKCGKKKELPIEAKIINSLQKIVNNSLLRFFVRMITAMVVLSYLKDTGRELLPFGLEIIPFMLWAFAPLINDLRYRITFEGWCGL